MKWEGKFSSLKYPPGMATGNIRVDIKDKSEYDTDVKIKYTGVYKKGQTITVQVHVVGDTMTLKLDDKIITFTVVNRSDKIISGNYKCKNPLDHGQFYLQPEGSPPIENTQSCLIM